MKLKSESYPEKIRRIAHDLGRLRNQYEVDHSVEKLRMIANELERSLKKSPRKQNLKPPIRFLSGDQLISQLINNTQAMINDGPSNPINTPPGRRSLVWISPVL